MEKVTRCTRWTRRYGGNRCGKETERIEGDGQEEEYGEGTDAWNIGEDELDGFRRKRKY